MSLTAPCNLLTFSTTVGLSPLLALRISRGLNPCSDVCSNSLCTAAERRQEEVCFVSIHRERESQIHTVALTHVEQVNSVAHTRACSQMINIHNHLQQVDIDATLYMHTCMCHHARSTYAYVYITTCSTSMSMPHSQRRFRHICIPRTSLMSGLLSVSFSNNSPIIVFISCVDACMRMHAWRHRQAVIHAQIRRVA